MLEAAEEWGKWPWEVMDECPAEWWEWWLARRAVIGEKQKRELDKLNRG